MEAWLSEWLRVGHRFVIIPSAAFPRFGAQCQVLYNSSKPTRVTLVSLSGYWPKPYFNPNTALNLCNVAAGINFLRFFVVEGRRVNCFPHCHHLLCLFTLNVGVFYRECTRGGFCNFMHLKPISRELRRELYGRRRKRYGNLLRALYSTY